MHACMMRAGRSAYAVVGVAVTLLVALPSAPAAAAQRFASALSSDTTGSCATGSPCRLDHAIAGASAGDEVVVEPGDYTVNSQLSAPVSMDLHGVAGQPRPRLIGAGGLNNTVLLFKAGGAARHLAIESSPSGKGPLTLESSLGEDLMLTSNGGEGTKVQGEGTSTTILRDSVVRSLATGSDVAALRLREEGGEQATSRFATSRPSHRAVAPPACAARRPSCNPPWSM